MLFEAGCHAVVRVIEDRVMVASPEKAGLEWPALVVCDLLGTGETRNPDGYEGFSDCFGGGVGQGECLRPPVVSVDGSETVPEARIDRQGPEKVNMHTRETCRWEVRLPVLRYLGSLGGCTRACPCAAVFPHSQPHKPLGHQLDGGVGSGVAKALEGVKDLGFERCCYEWPRLWSGCVTVKFDLRPWNVHPV
jgi:hypothetical protein